MQTARSLLAPMIDSAVSKSEGRLDAKYSTRIDLLETSVGSLETTVTSELRSFKAEMKEVLQGATAGPQPYQQQHRRAKEAGSDATDTAREVLRQLQRSSTSTSTSAVRSSLDQEASSVLGVWWTALRAELSARGEAR